MTLGTLNTILSSAPVILQGANKLIKMIRDRGPAEPPADESRLVTMEGLRAEIDRIENRLAAGDESDVEQIKLIEELARQNEALATSVRRMLFRQGLLMALCVLALFFAGAAFITVLR